MAFEATGLFGTFCTEATSASMCSAPCAPCRHGVCFVQSGGMLPIADAPRLTGFTIVRPRFESPQAETLDWLARAHTEAERAAAGDVPGGFDVERFHDEIGRRVRRFGCGPENIAMRGHEIADVTGSRWNEMLVYDFSQGPEGAGTGARTQYFAQVADRVFASLYDAEQEPPRDLLHVTCTGYASPSAAQRLVSRRGWGGVTRVLHAYHMGCYAALPAVRIAASLVRSEHARADVVHTEVCSLHLRPRQHAAEQVVVQSLFADGHVKYSLLPPGGRAEPSFALLGSREEILAGSVDSMTWTAGSSGMEMTLARDVPQRICGSVRSFVTALYGDAGLDLGMLGRETVFAVHPGGPRVIDAVQSALELAPGQVAASREVLARYGNMSSATLPHVWKALLESPDVARGAIVVSLAFGPGLTVAGSIMVKT